MLLLRQLLAVIGVAVLLYQQPFVARRSSKVVPLHLALNGALVMASSSPDSLSILNVTSRSLLTPLEYVKAQSSKNSTKRTLRAAFEKTERALGRITDSDTSLAAKLAAAPMPNSPAIGAYLLVVGAFASPILPGAEYLVLAGCGCLSLGCPAGMKSQPELFFVALLAAFGLYARSSASASSREIVSPPPRRRRKKEHSHDEHSRDEHSHDEYSHDEHSHEPCFESCGTPVADHVHMESID